MNIRFYLKALGGNKLLSLKIKLHGISDDHTSCPPFPTPQPPQHRTYGLFTLHDTENDTETEIDIIKLQAQALAHGVTIMVERLHQQQYLSLPHFPSAKIFKFHWSTHPYSTLPPLHSQTVEALFNTSVHS